MIRLYAFRYGKVISLEIESLEDVDVLIDEGRCSPFYATKDGKYLWGDIVGHLNVLNELIAQGEQPVPTKHMYPDGSYYIPNDEYREQRANLKLYYEQRDALRAILDNPK